MGRFVDVGKGSGRRPGKKFNDNYEQAFGPKKELETMKYLTDPMSGKLIPEYMWDQYDIRPPPPPKLHYVQRDAQDYTSPITDKLISGNRQHRYDLESHGCRVYEGRESEARAANAHLVEEDKRLDKRLDKSMGETLNDIRYQNNPPEKENISWTFGED